MALKLTHPARWLRVGSLCVLLVGLTACGRVEPTSADPQPQPVAKSDDTQPPAPAPKLPPSDPPPSQPKDSDKPSNVKPPTKQPDSKQPITGNPQEQQPFKIREIATLQPKGENDCYYALAFSPDVKTLAVAGVTSTMVAGKPNTYDVWLWDVAERKIRKTLRGPRAEVYALAFSPDGKMLASAGAGAGGAGEIHLWDAATGDKINTFNAPNVLALVAFSPNSKAVTSMTNDGFQLWDVDTGKKTTLKINEGMTTFSPDGNTLATVSYSPDLKPSTLKLWNAADGKNIATFSLSYAECAAAFSSDNKTVFAAGSTGGEKPNGGIGIYDVAKRQEVKTLTTEGNNRPFGFSSDGRILATGRYSKTVALWDVASGKNIGELGHTNFIVQVNNTVVFSRDTTHIATVTGTNTIHLWELSGGSVGTPNDK